MDGWWWFMGILWVVAVLVRVALKSDKDSSISFHADPESASTATLSRDIGRLVRLAKKTRTDLTFHVRWQSGCGVLRDGAIRARCDT